MKLQKVLLGALLAAFFMFLLQGVRLFLVKEGFFAVCNAEGAWGFAIPPTPLLIFGTIFLSGVLFYGLRSKNPEESLGFLLIFSGGGSNLLERFFFGCVTDYISIGFLPVFNGADILITLGVFCIFCAFMGVKLFPREGVDILKT